MPMGRKKDTLKPERTALKPKRARKSVTDQPKRYPIDAESLSKCGASCVGCVADDTKKMFEVI